MTRDALLAQIRNLKGMALGEQCVATEFVGYLPDKAVEQLCSEDVKLAPEGVGGVRFLWRFATQPAQANQTALVFTAEGFGEIRVFTSRPLGTRQFPWIPGFGKGVIPVGAGTLVQAKGLVVALFVAFWKADEQFNSVALIQGTQS